MNHNLILKNIRVILDNIVEEKIPKDMDIVKIHCKECDKTITDLDDIYLTTCCHYFHINCVKNWFLFNNNCPKCNKVIINHETRINNTKEIYTSVFHNFTIYNFILYLLGSNLIREVDINSMLKTSYNEIIFDDNIFQYINFYYDFQSILLQPIFLYIVLFISDSLLSSFWIFIFLLFQIITFRIITLDNDIIKNLFFINVENSFYYINYVFFILISQIIFVITSYNVFDNFSIKLMCLIKLSYWFFYFLLLCEVLYKFIYNTTEFFKYKLTSIIKSEFDGNTNLFEVYEDTSSEDSESSYTSEEENVEFEQIDSSNEIKTENIFIIDEDKVKKNKRSLFGIW